jgi:microcystin-dependent protein
VTVDPTLGTGDAPVPEATPTTADAVGAAPAVVADLADAIVNEAVPDSGPDTRPSDGAILRYGKVTALGTGVNVNKVQTDATGLAWLTYDAAYGPAVGDLVYLLTQGPVAHVGGKLGGSQPTAPPVGIIHPYAGATAPPGWLLCNGAAVSRTTYSQLFTVCGTTFGAGDGSTTFNIPNLVDRVATGIGSLYARGEKGGSETFTLSVSNLPSHTHSINHDHTSDLHSHSVPSSGDQVIRQGTTGPTATVSNEASGTSGTSKANVNPMSGSSGSTGSGTAVNNMPPYLGLQMLIRALP